MRVLWLFDATKGTSAPVAGWRAPLEATEHLADVSWSPQGDRLLVVARPLPGGARRSRAWFVDADGRRAAPAVTLPSDVAPGTAAWSPDGSHVGFVAHAGQINALCLLSDDGSFRYLADLEPSPGPPLAAPSLSWSPDGQHLLFVAPRQRTRGPHWTGWHHPLNTRSSRRRSTRRPQPPLSITRPTRLPGVKTARCSASGGRVQMRRWAFVS